MTHYSYFGSFRSDVSNIGPNAAFLNSAGQLTDIGSWYLGGNATSVIPDAAQKSNASTTKATSTYIMPALVTQRSHAVPAARRESARCGGNGKVEGALALAALAAFL